MIERYSRPEMASIWSLQNKFQTWLDVELMVLEIQEALGEIPQGTSQRTRAQARFSVERMDEIEAEVKHDVIAFLTCVNESLPAEDSRFLHKGMTSSDLVDTAQALQLKQAGQLLLDTLETFKLTVWQQAQSHKHTPQIGRSHGVHAEPVTFGLKLLNWYDELCRHQQRLTLTVSQVCVGQISGPVGTYSALDPRVETLVCERLGLTPSPISTQVISRDRHAAFLNDCALLASSLEKFAVEIRHLQRTEVLEVEEPFTKGQKGSSAMPHKRNPVASENITGLARMIRGYAQPMMENIALWHERDISHSSVERIVLPDATILLHYMLWRFEGVIRNLQVYPDRMMNNLLFKGGVSFSQHVLLALVAKGLTREVAYTLVQTQAHQAWQDPQGDFKTNLLNSSDILNYLSPSEIEACFDTQKLLVSFLTYF